MNRSGLCASQEEDWRYDGALQRSRAISLIEDVRNSSTYPFRTLEEVANELTSLKSRMPCYPVGKFLQAASQETHQQSSVGKCRECAHSNRRRSTNSEENRSPLMYSVHCQQRSYSGRSHLRILTQSVFIRNRGYYASREILDEVFT